MRYQDIVVGDDYGLRMRLSTSEPLHHVQVTQKVDGNKHVKVRHVEGENEGLEEFFPFRNLVVPWKQRQRFLRNEQSLRLIRKTWGMLIPSPRKPCSPCSEQLENTVRSSMATDTSRSTLER